MRDGADHLLAVPCDKQHANTGSTRAVENWVAIGNFAGWDIEKGYLCPTISAIGEGGTTTRGLLPLSASQMTGACEAERSSSRQKMIFSIRSLRSRGGVASNSRRRSVYNHTIMQRAFWKNPKTTWRCTQLAQVLSPGSSGYSIVPRGNRGQIQLNQRVPAE